MSPSTAARRAARQASSQRQVRGQADDVVAHRPRLQRTVLDHHADLLPHGAPVDALEIATVVVHHAGRGFLEAQEDAQHRALAGARTADQRHELAGSNVDGDVAQHQRAVLGVAEAHVVQAHLAAQLGRGCFPGGAPGRSLEDRRDLLAGRHDGGHVRHGAAERGDGRHQHHVRGVDGQKGACRQHGGSLLESHGEQRGGGQQGRRRRERHQMLVQDADVHLAALLFPVALRPPRESRPLLPRGAQFSRGADQLQQHAGQRALGRKQTAGDEALAAGPA